MQILDFPTIFPIRRIEFPSWLFRANYPDDYGEFRLAESKYGNILAIFPGKFAWMGPKYLLRLDCFFCTYTPVFEFRVTNDDNQYSFWITNMTGKQLWWTITEWNSKFVIFIPHSSFSDSAFARNPTRSFYDCLLSKQLPIFVRQRMRTINSMFQSYFCGADFLIVSVFHLMPSFYPLLGSRTPLFQFPCWATL